MLLGHFHVFAFLLKIIIMFNAQTIIDCEVLATDICAPKSEYQGHVRRVDIPARAGKEGIDLRNGLVYIDAQVVDEERKEQKNITWSIKFYVKIGPPKNESFNFLKFGLGDLNFYQLPNGGFEFYLYTTPWNASISWPEIGDVQEDVINDDSDWIELVGIKMKVSNRNKREVIFDNSGWTMFGFEYSKYPNEDGYARLYINGKLRMDSVLQRNTYHEFRTSLRLQNGEFSCIQYHKEKMSDAYFKDPNLKECKDKYARIPKAKFLACPELNKTW